MTVEDAIALIEPRLERGRLTPIQLIVFREAWAGKTYLEIAQAAGYDAGHVKDVGSELWRLLSRALGEKVTKKNVHGVLHRALAQATPALPEPLPVPTALPRFVDWGEAIDVSIFYGREHELARLHQWIEGDRCRLVTVLGMGGLGKTSLSIKLAETSQTQFEFVLWRSLRNAPPIEELLVLLIQFLSQHQDKELPDSLSGKFTRLIELLRRSRCLVVLDNFDAVLQSGRWAGTYRAGYEGYGELLKQVGEMAHQSCLVLTSREKPQEVATQEGDLFPVRTLPLTGVDVAAGHQILNAKGLQGAVEDLEQVIVHYRGNPLALKMAATSIRDLFAGDIPQFLAQGTVAFSGIGQLLHQQCDRLTAAEQSIMNWLAINREPVPLSELQADGITEIPTATLLQILESLRWRSLIESSAAGFTQQPVVMEYITESLIERVATEIVTEQPQIFFTHGLMKAQVKDYIRDSQARIIMQPLVDRLLMQLGSPKQVVHKLRRLLAIARAHPSEQPHYGAGNLLNLLRHLEADTTGYDFSGLSIRQAYLQDVSLHQVNFTQARFVDCAFAATFGGVTAVAFDPNGTHLATSDTNGSIQVWHLGGGQPCATCNGHDSWVWSVVFSPTQPILASCGQDHHVRLWNPLTGHCLQVLTGHTGIVTSVAFSPDGRSLVSTSGDQTVRIWNVATGTCTQVLHGHAACVWSAVFHPDGQRLFSGGEDNVIRVWDLGSGQCLQTVKAHLAWVRAIALNPTGTLLASGSFDQTIKLWAIAPCESGEDPLGACQATLMGHHQPLTSLAFSPDGQQLVSGSYDRTVKVWQAATWECIHTFQKHTNLVMAVAFHPLRSLVVSGGEDYTARLWDLATGQCTKTFQGHSNSIYAIALPPPDRAATTHQRLLLASGHEDETIKLWDLDLQAIPATQPFRSLRGHTGRVFSLAFTGDRQLLASGSSDRTIKFWNPHTGQCLHTLHGHRSWVWAIAMHPHSQLLASGSYDHTVRLWEVPTGECLHTLQGHTSSVLSVAFSPNGQWLASGGYEQLIKLWHPKTGECLQTWHAHLNRVWVVAFSPDSQTLATGGDDHTIKLWELTTGRCQQTLTGHTSRVLSLVFSPDGQTLLSGSADRTLRVWNLATGECHSTLQGHQSWCWSLVHLPQANLLLSGSQDETIKVWDLSTQTEWATLRSPRLYEGMIITQATGLTEAQQATLQALGAIAT